MQDSALENTQAMAVSEQPSQVQSVAEHGAVEISPVPMPPSSAPVVAPIPHVMQDTTHQVHPHPRFTGSGRGRKRRRDLSADTQEGSVDKMPRIDHPLSQHLLAQQEQQIIQQLEQRQQQAQHAQTTDMVTAGTSMRSPPTIPLPATYTPMAAPYASPVKPQVHPVPPSRLENLQLRILKQPPTRTVYQRILRPFPTVQLLGEASDSNHLFVACTLVRSDSDIEISNCLEGTLLERIASSLCATFRKLKILFTSQQQGTLFRLKFVLKRYTGSCFEYVQGSEVFSAPIEVFSHSFYLRQREGDKKNDSDGTKTEGTESLSDSLKNTSGSLAVLHSALTHSGGHHGNGSHRNRMVGVAAGDYAATAVQSMLVQAVQTSVAMTTVFCHDNKLVAMVDGCPVAISFAEHNCAVLHCPLCPGVIDPASPSVDTKPPHSHAPPSGVSPTYTGHSLLWCRHAFAVFSAGLGHPEAVVDVSKFSWWLADAAVSTLLPLLLNMVFADRLWASPDLAIAGRLGAVVSEVVCRDVELDAELALVDMSTPPPRTVETIVKVPLSTAVDKVDTSGPGGGFVLLARLSPDDAAATVANTTYIKCVKVTVTPYGRVGAVECHCRPGGGICEHAVAVLYSALRGRMTQAANAATVASPGDAYAAAAALAAAAESMETPDNPSGVVDYERLKERMARCTRDELAAMAMDAIYRRGVGLLAVIEQYMLEFARTGAVAEHVPRMRSVQDYYPKQLPMEEEVVVVAHGAQQVTAPTGQ